ncbi:MAG: manganese efflux pump [Clostridia bacterium]|nr:manganese efflux pump [Clostridia bacterium]
MTLFLILTALTVSIDSFFCGFSLSFSSKRRLPIVVVITLTVFVMCFITNYGVKFFSTFLTEKSSVFGGFILILVGIYNLIKKDNELTFNQTLKTALFSGFAVGLDGAVANLSLSLMGINAFYVPVTIAVMHGITIYLGTLLSSKKLQKTRALKLLSPLVLIFLGGYKILMVFL